MDQVDSLNEIMTSALPDTHISGGGDVNNAVMNTSSPVIAVAADLPSFHYFLNEQAKSILALQELQNEVGALLEFRDLVMEAFPQLGQKLQTFSNALQSQTALSPSKWEPGIRVKRKLGQQLRDPDMLVPSLLPRYRSNSQGKASRSSEVSGSATSSAIQDSGFCTESSKDHSSAISSRSKSRETEDELSSLLDHIHNKGTRLKLEVEYLWSRLNRKGSSSFSGANKRRCKSLDDLILTNSTHSFTFECAVKTAFLETELSGLKRERDMLLKKMNDIESEHLTNLAQTNRLLLELETISAEKRDLEERLQVAIHSESEINNRINDLHHNFLQRSQWRNMQTPLVKGQLLNLKQVFKDTNQKTSEDVAAHFFNSKNAISSTANSKDNYYAREHSQEPKNLSYAVEESRMVDRPANPVTKELNACSYLADSHKHRTKNKECESAATSVATLASTKDVEDATDSRLGNGVSVGKPDILIGFFSGHSSSIEPAKEGGVTLSKEKVLSILNECDPIELRRFLLTLSYQVEALEAHMQRVSKSRLSIFQQLSRYKIENEDLKFQLEEKNIQLEGTKARVRVLERMRNEKLSYSTSDLVTAIPKSTPDTRNDSAQFTCPVSDTALLSEKTGTALSNHISAKCMDLRDPSDRTKSGGSCRRSISKIPLKTYSSSKLPTKLSSSNKKTLTSFKEYSAPGPPHSSCISYTSSSISNK